MTVENVPTTCEQIKAVLEALSSADVSSTARLLAVLEAIGVSDRTELQRLLAVSDRMVRHARKQVAGNILPPSGNRLPETGCHSGNQLPQERKQIAAPETGCRKQVAGLARAHKESLRDTLTSEGKKESPLPPAGGSWDDEISRLYEQHANVSVLDGKVVLHNGTRAFWLEQFGGDEQRLDLALIEAGCAVQRNSRQPLEAQVSRTLARLAGDKRDRDARYAAAAKSRTAPAPRVTNPRGTVEPGPLGRLLRQKMQAQETVQ